NNFFVGLILLDGFFDQRTHVAFPDQLITRNRKQSRLKLWESVWFLTVMFHDPGYLPEDFGSLIEFGYGMQHSPGFDPPIPPDVVERIENAWDTEFLKARAKLGSIYCSVLARRR